MQIQQRSRQQHNEKTGTDLMTDTEKIQMQKRDSAASTNLATNPALFNEGNGEGK